ncbi:ERF family protein [Acinetobacter courvalinii]|uniref:ERF family protein n=1 Tax=Acinetobacter courvalinii TaxID=280147 RepID=UPI0018FF2FF1|nr:ERF family protein [Acinetobacter courvalinii]MBJ9958372.1 ERF family protein [Acinetobacter courvalinii]
MNAAISPELMAGAIPESVLDLPGLEQVFHHPTFIKLINELEAPKGHESDFGGFKYRSAEDVQAALKPLLLKYKCTVFTRKFDLQDGFEVYAYIVFKDQKYMRCDLPGVATFDFTKDLASNKKITKTQQYAAYQSYAKKYALCNLLLIDDSQHDLDAFSNEKIKDEKQNRGNQNYRQQPNNRVVTQDDHARVMKQIDDMPLNTPLDQAGFIFDGLRQQFPEFDQDIYNAGCAKYNVIMQHLESQSNTQNTAHQSQSSAGQTSHNQGKQQNNKAPISNANNIPCITNKQRDQLQAFINERGLDIVTVCNYLGIDTLMQIKESDLDRAKQEIEQLAKQEIKS